MYCDTYMTLGALNVGDSASVVRRAYTTAGTAIATFVPNLSTNSCIIFASGSFNLCLISAQDDWKQNYIIAKNIYQGLGTSHLVMLPSEVGASLFRFFPPDLDFGAPLPHSKEPQEP